MIGSALSATNLGSRAESVVNQVADRLSEISTADAILLGLAFAALYGVIASLRAATRFSPIKVEPLQQDDGAGAPVQALTALLRERLADAGAMPAPDVPAGAPSTALVEAVEASGVPQAKAAAKAAETLMKLLPARPAAYTLSCTLREGSKSDSAAQRTGVSSWLSAGKRLRGGPSDSSSNEQVDGAGVSFWLRPSGRGRELLRTVPGTPEAAVCRVADAAYMHVTHHSAQALPAWAKWHDSDAFDCFMQGARERHASNAPTVLAHLAEAAGRERTNLLVRLRIANLMERHAKDRDPVKCARAQAQALDQYLRIARLEPGLVEARYRASVLSAMLLSSLEDVPIAERQDVWDELEILGWSRQPGPVDEADNLAKLAKLGAIELRAVLQLLRPWYTLVREGRLRNELELRSEERRELRRTADISRHCRRIRKVMSDPSRQPPLVPVERLTRVSVELQLRRYRLSFRYMLLGWLNAGWQTHYNMACFYALLLRRAQRLPTPTPMALRRQSTFSRRALRHLNRAFQEGRGELPADWALERDPDFKVLRDGEEWNQLHARHSATPRSSPAGRAGGGSWESTLTRYLEDERRVPLTGQPDRPWGDPRRRARRWLWVTAACLAGVGALVVFTSPPHGSEWTYLAVAAGVAAVVVVRSILTTREALGSSKLSAPA